VRDGRFLEQDVLADDDRAGALVDDDPRRRVADRHQLAHAGDEGDRLRRVFRRDRDLDPVRVQRGGRARAEDRVHGAAMAAAVLKSALCSSQVTLPSVTKRPVKGCRIVPPLGIVPTVAWFLRKLLLARS
jgi:hypothetical protein